MKRIQSIDRVSMILDYISNHPESRLIDISNSLNIKNTTLHALLTTLEYWGFVEKSNNNKYSLGYKLYELGKIYESKLTIKDLCAPYMNELVKKFGETTHLAIPINYKIQYIHRVESPHSLRLTSMVGHIDESYVTASGKAIMAFWENKAIDKFLEEMELVPRTEYTIINKDIFKDHLIDIRNQGFAFDLEEYTIGLNCISAPIFNRSEKPIASISISMPNSRYKRSNIDSMCKELINTCSLISKEIKN
jgi:DNA-binding IclR family transcriptional regulator